MTSNDPAVLFLAGHLGPGGVTTHMSDLAQGLISRGFRVGIASRGASGDHNHGVSFFESQGVAHFTIDFPRSLSARNVRSAFSAWRAYSRVVTKFRPTIQHVHWRSTSAYAQYVSLQKRIPFVSTLHNANTPANWFHQRASYWGQFAIAVSSEAEQELVQRYHCRSDRVRRIPCGVDTSRFQLPTAIQRLAARAHFNLPDGVPVISLVGGGFVRKGHGMQLAAVQRLRAEGFACISVFAGDNNDASTIAKTAAELGIEDCVRHVGYCDTRDLLWATDILVLPSLREGLPIVLNEAMLCGVPHVRTPTSGMRDQTTACGTGLVVQFGDDVGLAVSLRRLLTDRVLYDRCVANGRELALREFSRHVMVERIVSVYDEVLHAEQPTVASRNAANSF